MKEKVIIENFGGIEYSIIELNSINVFIGKQAVGKSITAKLIYFFQGIFKEIFDGIQEDKTKLEIDKSLLKKFEGYFPSESWPKKEFRITFFWGEQNVIIERKSKSKLKISYSDLVKKQFSIGRRIIKKDKESNSNGDEFDIYRPSYESNEKYIKNLNKCFGGSISYNRVFIPAGRSFFANLQSSIFSFLSNNKAIDPFLVEFGSLYENFKGYPTRFRRNNNPLDEHVDKLVLDIMGGKHVREKNKDYLIHADKRKINVSFSSSGQQETLPLTVILNSLIRIKFTGDNITVFIEEPEAHLFPAAQKRIVELIATVFNNSRNNIQFVITTHSPYILTSFNNLIQAGIIKNRIENSTKKLKSLTSKVSIYEILESKKVNATVIENGQSKSLVNSNTGLIQSEILDSVSEEIATQFDGILDVED